MPNIIRPEDIAPYPWRAGRILVRILGGLCLGGGALTLVALFVRELAWFNRPPLELRGWLYFFYGLWGASLGAAGAGLVLVKGWGRRLGAAAGVVIAAVALYGLVANALAGTKDWVWTGVAIAAILLAYSLFVPLRPVFEPGPPGRDDTSA